MTENNPLPSQESSSEGMVTRRLDEFDRRQYWAIHAGQLAGCERRLARGRRALKKLGLRLGGAIQSGWKSGNEQELSTLQDQLRSMVDNVESAVRAARQEALSPETKAQTQRVVEVTKEAQASLVDEVRDLVVSGLRTLNTQLRELAERLDSSKK